MKYKSYEILQKFADALIKKGFDDLPLQSKERDLSDFQDLFESWIDKFNAAILSDLRKILGEDTIFNVERYDFEPMDLNAQGATYIYIKISGEKGGDTFFLRVKYLIFKNRIMIFLGSKTEIDSTKNKKLRKKLLEISDLSKEGYEIPLELNNLT